MYVFLEKEKKEKKKYQSFYFFSFLSTFFLFSKDIKKKVFFPRTEKEKGQKNSIYIR